MIPVYEPTPEAVRLARVTANLTQTDAAAVVHVALRTWQQYEYGERRMSSGLWELFVRKVGEL